MPEPSIERLVGTGWFEELIARTAATMYGEDTCVVTLSTRPGVWYIMAGSFCVTVIKPGGAHFVHPALGMN